MALGAAVDPYGPTFVLSLTWIVQGEGEPVAADDVESLEWLRPNGFPARWPSRARTSCFGFGPDATAVER